MKINIAQHVFITWLVAHLLHLLLFVLFMLMAGGKGEPDMVLLVVVWGILFSIPALIACMFVVWLIVKLPISNPVFALLLWMVFALASVVGCCMVLVGPDVFRYGFTLILPSILACMIAILIRCDQFENLFFSWKVPNGTGNETLELSENTRSK